MIEGLLNTALVIISIATIGLIYRAVKGPSTPDRVMALDAIGVNLIGMTGIVCVIFRTDAYFEVILLFGIISFIGTIAFSKFLEKGEIIENDRNR
ncbi:Na(+)/H(+) antiporter subunit F1 [Priestia abyssalis]|jgi:multicomponent Na+:H+ antiporter subunit F|uniref:Na(+)/H(+) antiporter subunit F1 n=1 Tax=Priestia abyssalis TaxID=1221450 RepID=UPI0009953701|nr:Na(+)/H(+) antiporter subunit F1 [Priestia abyssalis]